MAQTLQTKQNPQINRISEAELRAQEENYFAQLKYQQIIQANAEQESQRQAEIKRRKKKKSGTVLGTLGKWFGASGGLVGALASVGDSASAAVLNLLN